MLFAFHEKRYFGASAITFFALILFGEGFVISWLFSLYFGYPDSV